MSGGPADRVGKRARRTMERDDAIRKAAMAAARRKKWPSPAEVAGRTGISISVIERETALLLEARRKWQDVTGLRHPQWRDPDVGDADGATPSAPAPKEPVVDDVKALKERLRVQRRTIEGLRDRVGTLEEQVRRLLIGIRPAGLDRILEIGAPKRSNGKTKKRVRVGT